MSVAPRLVEIELGRCWWCGALADSSEHKLKRSDLVREFGPPPYFGGRTLQRVAGDRSQEPHGPGSAAFKFDPSMCARCNNNRSQPFDRAWDTFTKFLADNEGNIVATQGVDLCAVFGEDWRARGADVARYVVKHLICRIVQELPGPIQLDAPVFEFLDGGAFPECLQIDTCLDLGVVAMLEMTREAPAEDPRAALAGFLHLGPVWVELDERQHWHTPQGGMRYRWLALYWRIGDGGARNPFARSLIPLRPSDELLGPDFRGMMDILRGIPAEVLQDIPNGTSQSEAIRAAGYTEAADRVEELVDVSGSDAAHAASARGSGW